MFDNDHMGGRNCKFDHGYRIREFLPLDIFSSNDAAF